MWVHIEILSENFGGGKSFPGEEGPTRGSHANTLSPHYSHGPRRPQLCNHHHHHHHHQFYAIKVHNGLGSKGSTRSWVEILETCFKGGFLPSLTLILIFLIDVPEVFSAKSRFICSEQICGATILRKAFSTKTCMSWHTISSFSKVLRPEKKRVWRARHSSEEENDAKTFMHEKLKASWTWKKKQHWIKENF
jgi:hypothetical protein